MSAGSARPPAVARPGGVAREIKQKRAFSSRAEEAVVALLVTADHARRRVAEALAAESVGIQQFNVLRILRGAGSEGLPTLEIAERMIEKTPGITGLVDRLTAKGLVERERSSDDRRLVICRITEKGRSLLARLDAPILAADEAVMAGLKPADIDQLLSLFDRIRGSR